MSRTKKGFTLIELLVVIAIIALLVSILMPALGRAKEQAKRVVCAANIRHQGIAFSEYLLDHGKYPHRMIEGLWPNGGMMWDDDYMWNDSVTDNSDIFAAGQAALFEGGYLEFTKEHYSWMYCPSNRNYFRYEEVFLNEQEKGLVQAPHPDYPNAINYKRFFVGYPYWNRYAWNEKNNEVFIPELKRLVVMKETDNAEKVLATDLTVTESSYGVFDSHKSDHPFTNHTMKGETAGGQSLYNDIHVEWNDMKKMQSDSDRHLWVSTATNLYFWF